MVDIEVYGDHKPKKSTRKKRRKKRDKKKTMEVYDPEEQEIVPVEAIDTPVDEANSTIDIEEGKDEEDTNRS